MKTDPQLKWQSWVDAELSDRERAELTQALAHDPQAQALVDELAQVRSVLRGNESARPLPVSGDFYWSRIEARLTAVAPARSRWMPEIAWRSLWCWWAPLGATAALVLLLLNVLPGRPPIAFVAEEIETQLQEANFYSYRSLSEGISVVWVDTQVGSGISSHPDEDNDYYLME